MSRSFSRTAAVIPLPDYQSLTEHLRECASSPATMVFSDLESIVGPLPVSAHKYREWWANHACNSQAKGWLIAGWEVSTVSISDEQVVFVRIREPSDLDLSAETVSPGRGRSTAAAFEETARQVLENRWGVRLPSRRVMLGGRVEKSFDFVSPDHRFVGDAKYYKTLKVPAGKWSTIAEYVWLLQHLNAENRFLVFGNDRDVPARWLSRFAALTDGVQFFFLDDDGRLSDMKKTK